MSLKIIQENHFPLAIMHYEYINKKGIVLNVPVDETYADWLVTQSFCCDDWVIDERGFYITWHT